MTAWSDSLSDVLKSFDAGERDLAGWTAKDVEELERKMRGGAGELEEDEVPEPPANPVTQVGDVWTLGKHRLVCGDCRVLDTVRMLMGDERVNVAFTSPPYASQRKYDESSGFEPIAPDAYVQWFEAVQANVRSVLADDGSWFVNIKPSADGLDTSLYVFDLVIAHARLWGWHFATEFCWERTGVPKHVKQRFKNQFEPIYQFAIERWKMRPDAARHESASVPVPGGKGVGTTTWGNERQGRGTQLFGTAAAEPGLAYPGNRLPPFAAGVSLGHSAAFPVGLPAFFIRAYSDPADSIFDPFMGSGTTIIAAEQLERIGYGIELSPAYCDVIVQRWESLCGGKATRSHAKV